VEGQRKRFRQHGSVRNLSRILLPEYWAFLEARNINALQDLNVEWNQFREKDHTQPGSGVPRMIRLMREHTGREPDFEVGSAQCR
jgi:hypothetical protein